MPSCPEVDVLVTLGGLSADPLVALDHMAGCDDCRDRVRTLADARAALLETADPRVDFTDRVMEAIRAEAKVEAPPAVAPVESAWSEGSVAAPGWLLLNGLLAAAIAVFAAGAAAPAAPGSGGASVLLIAGIGAAAGILGPRLAALRG